MPQPNPGHDITYRRNLRRAATELFNTGSHIVWFDNLVEHAFPGIPMPHAAYEIARESMRSIHSGLRHKSKMSTVLVTSHLRERLTNGIGEPETQRELSLCAAGCSHQGGRGIGIICLNGSSPPWMRDLYEFAQRYHTTKAAKTVQWQMNNLTDATKKGRVSRQTLVDHGELVGRLLGLKSSDTAQLSK